MKRILFVANITGLLMVLAAGQTLSAKDTFSLYGENDSRYLKPNGKSDRHYTNGAKIVYTTQPDWQWLREFGNWDGLADAATTERAVGFFFGQNMYTPDQADEPFKRYPRDRVFAGWLYTGMFVQRREGATLDHLEFNLGVVGPSSLAENAQRCIHKIANSGETIGWEDQLEDEPAADAMWVRKQRHEEGLLAPTEHTDVITDFGATVGSLHRHAEAGIMLRYGLKLPNDFGPGRLTLPTSAASLGPNPYKSLYLFSRLSGRAVEYDRFLTGLTHQPFVGRAEVGVVCRFNNFEIAYAQTFMTQEYDQQDANDSYGALTLTWLF